MRTMNVIYKLLMLAGVVFLILQSIGVTNVTIPGITG